MRQPVSKAKPGLSIIFRITEARPFPQPISSCQGKASQDFSDESVFVTACWNIATRSVRRAGGFVQTPFRENGKSRTKEQKAFEFAHGVYWRMVEIVSSEEDEEGNKSVRIEWEGPFCHMCKDANGKTVRLQDRGKVDGGNIHAWWCPIDKHMYNAPMKP